MATLKGWGRKVALAGILVNGADMAVDKTGLKKTPESLQILSNLQL